MSVMSVEIDDEDALDAQVVDSVFRRYCDVVAQTEAVELICHSVVTGRPNESNTIRQLPCSKKEVTMIKLLLFLKSGSNECV